MHVVTQNKHREAYAGECMKLSDWQNVVIVGYGNKKIEKIGQILIRYFNTVIKISDLINALVIWQTSVILPLIFIIIVRYQKDIVKKFSILMLAAKDMFLKEEIVKYQNIGKIPRLLEIQNV